MAWNLGSGLEDLGVVVTGANGGIGSETVRAFEAAGARVCATDLRQEALDDLLHSLEHPDRHIAIAGDLSRRESHADLLGRSMTAFGKVGVLAHVAAVLKRRQTAAKITEEDWDLQLGVNLKSSFFLNMAAGEMFRQQGHGGRIINLVSTSWWTGGTSVAIPYASSKGGLVSMSRGLAKTFASDNITVNTVAPGGVDTAMMRADLTQEQVDAYVATVPIGRLAHPREIASGIVFLASAHAGYITGTTLNISGGQLLY